MHLAVGQSVRIFTRCLYDLMGQKPLHVWSWHLALNEGALSELQFWQANFDRLHGAPLWLDPHVETVLFTDAGAQGWRGFLVEHGKGQTLEVPSTLEKYFAAGGSLLAQGFLNPIEQLQSSTWRELIAIERTLWSLVRNLSFKIIRLFTDNLAVAYVWLSGSRKDMIQKVVKQKHCCSSTAGSGALAPLGSMHWPMTGWREQLGNPPFALIGKVLLHMKACKAVGTVIVPWWPKREWWPLLRARNGASWAPYVVGERCLNINRQADVFLPSPGSANTIVAGAPKWAVYALRVDFRTFK